jgi:hypothetical protein
MDGRQRALPLQPKNHGLLRTKVTKGDAQSADNRPRDAGGTGVAAAGRVSCTFYVADGLHSETEAAGAPAAKVCKEFSSCLSFQKGTVKSQFF